MATARFFRWVSLLDRDRLLSLRDVELILGLTRWTLYELIKNGKLPAVKLSSGHYRVRAAVVEAMAQGQDGDR